MGLPAALLALKPIVAKVGAGATKMLGGGEKGGGKKMGGAIAAGAIGGIQAISGAIQQRKADRMLPQAEDPEMRNALTQARRKQRAFQTGTALAAERNALAKQLGTGQSRMLRYGGGGRKGLLQMQEVFNKGMMGLAQQSIEGETAASAQANKLLEGISQRKLDLQMQRYDTAQARAAQKKAAANRNLGLFLGKTLATGQETEDADVSNTAKVNPVASAVSSKPATYDEMLNAASLPFGEQPYAPYIPPTSTPANKVNTMGGVQSVLGGIANQGQAAADLFRTFGTGQ
jgi:hypothetical protein